MTLETERPVVLITGWTGMLGQHILHEFESRDKRDDLLLLAREPRAEEPRSIGVDITCPVDFDASDFSRVTHVIHCASAIPARSTDTYDVNVTGTRNLLAALPLDRLESYVQVSSISVYETPHNQHESAPKTDTGYGWTKLRQEEIVRNALPESTSYAVFRPSSIYGVGMAEGTVLPIFLKRAGANQTITIDAPGYRQSFIWAGDVARIIVEATIREVDGVFNLFSDEVVDLHTLADTIVHATGSSSRIEVEPSDSTTEPVSPEAFPIDRLKQQFPNVQFLSLAEGVRELTR